MRRDPLITGPAHAAVLGRLLAGACAGLVGLLAGACAAVPPASMTLPPGTPDIITVAIETAGGADQRFVPATITVPSGAEIRLVFRNQSMESHNLSFTGGLETVRTQTIMEPGQEEVLTFRPPGPGTYPFVCTVHVGMTGELRVLPSGRSP